MTDKTLLNAIGSYLEITIYQKGVRYVVLDEQRGVLLQQEINFATDAVSEAHLSNILLQQPDLQLPAHHTTIFFESTPYQLIPDELFRAEDTKALFEIEHPLDEQQTPLFYPIPKWGVHFVFSLSQSLQSVFETKYPHATIKHRVGEWLKMKITKQNALYLYVQEGLIDVVLVKDEMLHLVSSYEARSPQDIAYYILKLYETKQLERTSFLLQISESKALDTPTVELLREYVKNVIVVK